MIFFLFIRIPPQNKQIPYYNILLCYHTFIVSEKNCAVIINKDKSNGLFLALCYRRFSITQILYQSIDSMTIVFLLIVTGLFNFFPFFTEISNNYREFQGKL